MIAALITARGVQQGYKDNALLPLLGRPIISYPYLAAFHSNFVDEIFLTSDGLQLQHVANNLGIEFIERPTEFSRKDVGHGQVINHALSHIENSFESVEILVVLLGNVATHEVGIVDKTIEVLKENSHVDSCVTISERNEFHPLRSKRTVGESIHEDDSSGPAIYEIEPFIQSEGTVSTNRQDLEPVYFLNHAVWALRPEICLSSNKGQWPGSFVGQTVVGVETDHGIDIRTQEDLAFSQQWLMSHGWSMNNSPYWSS